METLGNTSFVSRNQNMFQNRLILLPKWATKPISLPSFWCPTHLAVYYLEYLLTAQFGDWTSWCSYALKRGECWVLQQ